MNTPEKSLWVAVVQQAISDAEAIVSDMRGSIKSFGCIDEFLERKFIALRRELETPWFKELSQWAGIHSDHICRYIKGLEQKPDVVNRVIISHLAFRTMVDSLKAAS